MAQKTPTSFRLSDDCHEYLNEMASELGLNTADIVELSVRYYRKEAMPGARGRQQQQSEVYELHRK